MKTNTQKHSDTNENHCGFDFLAVLILAFLAIQLYFLVGFLGISLDEWF